MSGQPQPPTNSDNERHLTQSGCNHRNKRDVGITAEGAGRIIVEWCPDCGSLKRTMVNWTAMNYPWERPTNQSSEEQAEIVQGLQKSLQWAIRNLDSLVRVTGDGSAYERETGVEVAGYAAAYDEAKHILNRTAKLKV